MMAANFVDNFASWLAPQPKSGSSSARRGDASAANSSDALFAYMDQMRLALRGLGEELTAVEERQMGFDRRLSEMSSALQQVKEGQDEHTLALERAGETAQKLEKTQRMLAKSTQRALEEAVSAQQQLVEEEFAALVDRGSIFPPMTFGPSPGVPPSSSSRGGNDAANPDFVANMIHKFESRLEHRLRDVARRIETAQLERERRVVGTMHQDLEKQEKQLERHLSDVWQAVHQQARQAQAPPPPPPPPPPAPVAPAAPPPSARESTTSLQRDLEARVDLGMRDVVRRIDTVQQETSKQISDVRFLARQVPEIQERVEDLGIQCEQNFAKVQEYSVQFGFFRTSFEAHRQQVLDAIHQLRHPSSVGEPAAEFAASTMEPEPQYSTDVLGSATVRGSGTSRGLTGLTALSGSIEELLQQPFM